MPKVEFFLGRPKQVEFEAKRPMIVEESKVQSDYAENDPSAPSYILNRPFYSETVTEPLEITWDGAWGGRPYIVLVQEGFEGICLVKVSDEFFDAEQLRSGYVTFGGSGDATIPISELSIQTINIGNAIIHSVTPENTIPLLFSASENVNADGIQAEKGIYFLSSSLRDEEYTGILQRLYVSSLSFPSVTYEKYYKLDNNFVDAEWMATESEGVGTKKFSLVNFSDALVVGGVVRNFPVVHLDSRPYTEEELKGARLTFDIENVPFAWTVANTVTIDNGLVATMLGIADDAAFYLLSMEEDGILGELPLKKGLYILTDAATDFSEVSNLTLEIFNATGQTIPNKLPNKFLDLDWVPKADTYTELLYEGTIEGEGSEDIPFDPQLLDLDTTLLLTANGVTIEARAAGTPLLGVSYIFHYTESEYIAVDSFGTAAYLDYIVAEPMTDVSIGIVKKAANPIPRHFLPEGVGNKAVVEIDHPLANGLEGYEATIEEAWNSGATVELLFSDAYLTLLSFYILPLDGVVATAITAEGRVYLFDPLERGNGWALNIRDLADNPASVLYKAEGSEEFVPTHLNSTLTEGSTLPAQEGAVFAAIQGLENTIGTLNQDLENRLNGGT